MTPVAAEEGITGTVGAQSTRMHSVEQIHYNANDSFWDECEAAPYLTFLFLEQHATAGLQGMLQCHCQVHKGGAGETRY